jgi:hypothetical protein
MSIGSEKVPIRLIARGTESSNPLPSSGESTANLIFEGAFHHHPPCTPVQQMGVLGAQTCAIHISLPRFHYRVSLHIVLGRDPALETAGNLANVG